MNTSIPYQINRTVGPALEPVTVDELKDFARIDIATEDASLVAMLIRAREAVERQLCRALMRQTFTLTLDQFPGWNIPLPRPTLASVSGIVYLDAAGASQTLAASIYQVAGVGGDGRTPGYITPAYGKYYPATRPQPEAVVITYLAGVTTRGEVDQAIRQEILRLAAWEYENREADGTTAPISPSFKREYECAWEPEYPV